MEETTTEAVKKLTPEYLAGLFDGEGYVGVTSWRSGASYGLRASITNTDLKLLQTVQQSFGGVITAKEVHIESPEWKNRYHILWYSSNVKTLMTYMLPHLISKKKQAELALIFPLNDTREYRSTELISAQKEIYDKLKLLKREMIEVPAQYKQLAVQEHSEYLRKKQQTIDLRKQHPDWSIRQISTEMKVSPTMVHKYLKDSGVSTKKEGYGSGVAGKLVYKYRKPPTNGEQT